MFFNFILRKFFFFFGDWLIDWLITTKHHLETSTKYYIFYMCKHLNNLSSYEKHIYSFKRTTSFDSCLTSVFSSSFWNLILSYDYSWSWWYHRNNVIVRKYPSYYSYGKFFFWQIFFSLILFKYTIQVLHYFIVLKYLCQCFLFFVLSVMNDQNIHWTYNKKDSL